MTGLAIGLIKAHDEISEVVVVVCFFSRQNLQDAALRHICPCFYISCYIQFLAPSFNGEESLKNLQQSDPDLHLHQNVISLSSSHTQPAHKISSESVHNFLGYCDIYHFTFQPDLSMVKNRFKNKDKCVQVQRPKGFVG